MKDLQLRKGTLDDLPTLYEFEQGIIEAERPFDETLKPGHINYYDLREMIESTKTDVVVAELGTEVIGSAYVTIRQSKPYLTHTQFAYLGFMFVKPAYRGKSVSKKIIEEVKEIARSKGINELVLEVYEDNDSAIRAYEKAGFKKHLVNMRVEI